ncbi:hypothetical protein EGK58_013110 [Acinetobacter variabilis]|uniref:DUF6088 family protein n=1 Tax=Acinetobacter TaxID=469 RepID=UPI000F676C62|nr:MULTISPECIES: DUF6088 family protein [Acinetobacter]QXR18986.1 hypothetical protein EGK58_013110 [Acinetobacter variabilis]
MSDIAKAVQERVKGFRLGYVFSVDEFEQYGKTEVVYLELHRLNAQGVINRIQHGVYYKPEPNIMLKGRYLSPNIYDVVKVIAEKNGEFIQVHGGMAANRLELSTQVPVMDVFYTSGYSREFKIGGTQVRLLHTKNNKFFQYPFDSRVGMAISALLFLGKKIVDLNMVRKLEKTLTSEEWILLSQSSLPAWLHNLLDEQKTKSYF